MLKKVVKYEDFDGNEREEAFYFNLTEAEATEMELSKNGGLIKFIETVVQEQDGPTMVKLFKDLVLTCYGEKSPDGKFFFKNDDIRAKFAASPVYSIIFMELATSAEAASIFINGVAPQTK